ncbi:MAG: hypothetical protein HY400_02045 [Elusimicrobia bacterium]|nr:hypothetical protein [Elusimicrobiota bacterium]
MISLYQSGGLFRICPWLGVILLLSLAFFSFPLLSFAAFDDIGFGARAAGLGGAFTAVDQDFSSLAYNPAGLGALKRPEIQSNFLNLFRIPAGEDRIEQMAFGGAYPLSGLAYPGAVGVEGRISTIRDRYRDREWGVGYGTYRWFDWGKGTLDGGVGLKALNRSLVNGTENKTAVAADLGGLYRIEERIIFGVSLLNINTPDLTVAGIQEKAPFAFKLGVAEKNRDFLLSLDFTQRAASGPQSAGYTIAAGAEYGWLPFRYGSVAARTGLSLGNGSKTWNLGASYRLMGMEFHYAFLLPLSSTFQMSHVLSLVLRFGESDPQEEYERVLRQEMRSREDLLKVLEASSQKEEKMALELENLQKEFGLLRKKLETKSVEASESKERLKEISERHQKLEENLKAMKVHRKKVEEGEIESRFRQEWASYRKLKSGGAPTPVLRTTLERILKQYKGKGVNLGDVNLELRTLLE